MPIYEYRCNDCGHHFEVTQRMSDDPFTECEVCGGEVVKVLFAPAIHFKGSGFHNTDYVSRRRSGDEAGGGSADGGSGDGAAKGGSGDGAAAGSSSGSSDSSSGSSSGGSSKTVGLDKV